jgi:hypothetical protein
MKSWTTSLYNQGQYIHLLRAAAHTRYPVENCVVCALELTPDDSRFFVFVFVLSCDNINFSLKPKGGKSVSMCVAHEVACQGIHKSNGKYKQKKRYSRCYWFVLLPNIIKKGGRRSDDEILIMVNAYSACWTVFCFLFGKIHANEIAQ